jgi:DNA topoisomerase I
MPRDLGNALEMGRLRRVDCSTPGITRRRRGRGFEFLLPDSERLDDPGTLDRIRSLAIPPAWEDVWICMDPRGHLQATGIDAAGRKQYLYHSDWRARRDQQKFDEMLEFAEALPRLRRVVRRDLRGEDADRERVLAAAVRLLDRGMFRIGSEDYAEQNQSYGLATLLQEHVTLNGTRMHFRFPAKSGQQRKQVIEDAAVLPVLKTLKQRRGGGPELLAFRDGRRWRDVTSDDINAYLKAATGVDSFSAKDFRTWNGTVLAATALAGDVPETKTARKRSVNEAVKTVAFFLGNTPAVCRASYIDPRVIDRFQSGWTIGIELRPREDPFAEDRRRRRIERAVIDLISDPRDSPLVERS